MEYRPLDSDDDRFVRAVRYAFQPEAGTDLPADEERGRRRASGFESRALFPDGADAAEDPLAVCGYYRLRAHIRDATVDLGAISALASPPEGRRQDHARTLLREVCEELRAEAVGYSALWPFDRGFYRRLGWATCNRICSYEAPPEQLRSAAAPPRGTWRRADAEDWAALDAVHEAHAAGRELYVERTESWWRHRILRGWEEDPFAYLWVGPDGEPGAYLVYTFAEGDGEDLADRTLSVRDFGHRDEAAYRQVLAFLGNHDSQVETVRWRQFPAFDLLDRVADPGEIDCEVHAGPMFRVEDPTALDALVAPSASGRIVFELSDPLVGDNDGTYVLDADADARANTDADAGADADAEPEAGRATCSPTDAAVDADADADAGADLALSVGDLSQVVVGYRRARALARTGRLSADPDSDAVARLDELFPPGSPFLHEGF